MGEILKTIGEIVIEIVIEIAEKWLEIYSNPEKCKIKIECFIERKLGGMRDGKNY